MAKISILIAFLPHLLYAAVPRNPSLCSEYFTYKTTPGITEILGQIEIVPPSANDTFYLKVALNINAPVSQNQDVRLELARSIQETVQNVHYGRPLLYYVYYPEPMQEPIPTLSAIWFNNQRYCPGPETSDSITATIELGHILYPPSEEPFVYNYGSWQEISQVWNRNASDYRIDNPNYNRLNKVFDFDLNECGITDYYNDDTNRLISDGAKVLPGQWPWLATIYIQEVDNPDVYQFRCSGSILTTRHIITAAPCVMTPDIVVRELIDPQRVYVSLGQKISPSWKNDPGIINCKVKEYKISSSSLNIYTRLNELAILILETAVEYNAFIRPICLWAESNSIVGNSGLTGYIVGWGSRNLSSAGRTYLHNQAANGRNRAEFAAPTEKYYVTNLHKKIRCPSSDDLCLYNEEPQMAKVRLTGVHDYQLGVIHLLSSGVPNKCYDDTGSGLVIYNTTMGRYQLYAVTIYCQGRSRISRYFEIFKQIPWILQQISTT